MPQFPELEAPEFVAEMCISTPPASIPEIMYNWNPVDHFEFLFRGTVKELLSLSKTLDICSLPRFLVESDGPIASQYNSKPRRNIELSVKNVTIMNLPLKSPPRRNNGGAASLSTLKEKLIRVLGEYKTKNHSYEQENSLVISNCRIINFSYHQMIVSTFHSTSNL